MTERLRPRWATKDIGTTTTGLQHVHRGSSTVLLLVWFFLQVNPLAATHFSPHVSSLERARTVRSRGLHATGSNMLHKPQIRRNGSLGNAP
jgi:hypothetical protein